MTMAMARELGSTPEMEDRYGPVIVANVVPPVDLSDLLTGSERTAAIIERDADAALNLATQAEDVILSEYYGMPLEVPDEPTWIREASELPVP